MSVLNMGWQREKLEPYKSCTFFICQNLYIFQQIKQKKSRTKIELNKF